jgi:hypothetical protein
MHFSFSIFQRARPAAPMSATLALPSGRLVTQALE